MPSVNLPVNKTSVPKSFSGHVESDAHISIEAEHTNSNTSSKSAHYAIVSSYGRTLSGVTLLPVLAPSQEPQSSPRLTYNIYTFTNITANVTLYLGPSLNTDPTRPLKYAIAVDDAKPKIVQYVPSTPLGKLPPEWIYVVSNGVWTSATNHTVTSGSHKLHLWALEPGVVFQKIVMNVGGVRDSYLGPPESIRLR
jgi:hypothetical protein